MMPVLATGRAPSVAAQGFKRYALPVLACAAATAQAPAVAAVNSYRFLHVTIDTPWHIFIFLLMGIFAPFVLMVVLMWRNSNRRHGQPKPPAAPEPPARQP